MYSCFKIVDYYDCSSFGFCLPTHLLFFSQCIRALRLSITTIAPLLFFSQCFRALRLSITTIVLLLSMCCDLCCALRLSITTIVLLLSIATIVTIVIATTTTGTGLLTCVHDHIRRFSQCIRALRLSIATTVLLLAFCLPTYLLFFSQCSCALRLSITTILLLFFWQCIRALRLSITTIALLLSMCCDLCCECAVSECGCWACKQCLRGIKNNRLSLQYFRRQVFVLALGWPINS